MGEAMMTSISSLVFVFLLITFPDKQEARPKPKTLLVETAGGAQGGDYGINGNGNIANTVLGDSINGHGNAGNFLKGGDYSINGDGDIGNTVLNDEINGDGNKHNLVAGGKGSGAGSGSGGGCDYASIKGCDNDNNQVKGSDIIG